MGAETKTTDMPDYHHTSLLLSLCHESVVRVRVLKCAKIYINICLSSH